MIDGAATTLTIRLPDGRARELVVGAAEADALAARGRNPTSGRTRALRAAGGLGRKLVKWLLVGVLAALVVPAITKQWTDRQKELELKKSLASDIGSSAYGAFADARALAYAPPRERTPERRLEVLGEWARGEGQIDGIFRVYFFPTPKHAVTQRWIDFRDAMHTYLRLACCEDRRQSLLADLQRYLRGRGRLQSFAPSTKRRWHALWRGPREAKYADAYDWLGLEVLHGAPYRAIASSKPNGLSSGFRDWLRDVVPGY